MIIKIIKEHTKAGENENVTNEQVLAWVRKVDAQKAKSTILSRLSETKDFGKISMRKRVNRQRGTTASTDQNACEAKMQLLWLQPSAQTMPSI